MSNAPNSALPFGGAASVLLRKGRSYGEVYNERDGEIVNLFRVVRRRVERAAHADGAEDRTECLWMNYESVGDLFR